MWLFLQKHPVDEVGAEREQVGEKRCVPIFAFSPGAELLAKNSLRHRQSVRVADERPLSLRLQAAPKRGHARGALYLPQRRLHLQIQLLFRNPTSTPQTAQ